MAAPRVIWPVPELKTALAPMVAAEVPRLMTLFVVVMLFDMVLAPVVWVTPPVKVQVLPNVTLPVFEKVVAPAMELPAPVNDTLYAAVPAAADIPVVIVAAPWNATVVLAPPSVMVTVAAPTVLWNVTPPDLVIVMVPINVPTAPLTVTAPVVLKVTFDAPDE